MAKYMLLGSMRALVAVSSNGESLGKLKKAINPAPMCTINPEMRKSLNFRATLRQLKIIGEVGLTKSTRHYYEN